MVLPLNARQHSGAAPQLGSAGLQDDDLHKQPLAKLAEVRHVVHRIRLNRDPRPQTARISEESLPVHPYDWIAHYPSSISIKKKVFRHEQQ
jgi:hypothetical protein